MTTLALEHPGQAPVSAGMVPATFAVEPNQAAAPAAEPGKRKQAFRGVANSGQPMSHWYWGSLVIDLEGLAINRQDLPVLRDHDSQQIVGYTTSAQVTDEGVVVEGFLIDATPAGAETLALLDAGVPLQMSCWVPPTDVLFLSDGEATTVNGAELKGPGAVFRKATFREATVTALGVDEQTSVEALAAGAARLSYASSRLREERETSMTTVKKDDPSTLAGGGTGDEAAKLAAQVEQARCDAIKDERERIAFAQRFSDLVPADLVQKAIDEGWSRERIGEEFLTAANKAKAERLDKLTAAAPSSAGGGADGDAKLERFQEGQRAAQAKPAKERTDDELRAEWQASEELQAQFYEFADYLFAVRNDDGRGGFAGVGSLVALAKAKR